MLRDAGVRTKLLAVLAIPTLLLTLVTALLVGGQVSEARRAGQVSALAEVGAQVNKVVHGLQHERSATLLQLEAPTSDRRSAMVAARSATDTQLTELNRLVDATSLNRMPQGVRAALDRSAAGHAELPGARRSIDESRFYATETDVLYGKVIRVDLDLPARIASSGTPELAQTLQAYQALSSSIEYSAHERDLVQVALLSGTLNEAEFAQTAALVAQQRQSLQDFQGSATAAVFARLDTALAGADNFEIDQVRRMLPDLLKGTEPDPAASTAWVKAAGTRISAMTTAETGLVSDIGSAASATQLGQERRALVLVVLAVVGLGLALLLAVGLARRITRPLRRLTVSAGEIGAELPHMVERLQTPGEGPGVVVEPIPVESADEIGQLAAAFNTVNEVTVQVAKEQAALRSSIAEMFVNVARRNQVLLGRQLKALDTMEATEEDPDVLERLFTLDHLATRMRRNAESLLVLAGIDSTRRLRSALPLSDVIRTAVGEIEAYDRIDLSMSLSEDADVSGRHALALAHLLAELLENATHFSNPETRVVVSAAVTASGVDITVTDSGLGMSEDEIMQANRAIAAPPVAEIAVSQRLGLFVVGRLAARLGAVVTLHRGTSSGTVVTTSLPAEIFEVLEVLAPVEPEPVVVPDIEVVAEVVPEAEAATQPFLFVAEPVAVDPVVHAAVEPVPVSPPVLVARPDPQPAPEPAPVAAPEPEPVAPPVVAAAIDVLPSLPPTGRLGRHRSHSPAAMPQPPQEPVTPLRRHTDRAPVHVVQPPPVAEAAPVAETAPVAAVTPAVEAAPVAAVAPAVETAPVHNPVPLATADPQPVPAAKVAPLPTRVPARPAVAAPLPSRGPSSTSRAVPAPLFAPPAAPAQPEPPAATSPQPAAVAPTQPAAVQPQKAPEAPVADPTPVPAEPRGGYRPAFAPTSPVTDTKDTGLVRRTPRPEAPTPVPVVVPAGPNRPRTAADVRGMLSGFRAGVERGRAPAATVGAATDTGTDSDPDAGASPDESDQTS